MRIMLKVEEMDFCELEASLVLYRKLQASKIYMMIPWFKKNEKKNILKKEYGR